MKWESYTDEQISAKVRNLTRQAIHLVTNQCIAEGDVSTLRRVKAAQSAYRADVRKLKMTPGQIEQERIEGEKLKIREAEQAANIVDLQNYKMKDVEDFEGIYAVTTCGKVWSYRKIKFMRPTVVPSGKGYLSVRLCAKGVPVSRYVHRMVASAYIPNPLCKGTVNHVDGDTRNNLLENLEWATPKEQVTHAISTGLFKVGSLRKQATINEEIVRSVLRLLEMGLTQKAISEATGIATHNIYGIRTGRTWKHVTL